MARAKKTSKSPKSGVAKKKTIPNPELGIPLPASIPPVELPPSESLQIWKALFGWVLITLSLLAFQHFHPIYITGVHGWDPDPLFKLTLLLFIGACLMGLAYRKMTQSDSKDDIGKVPARLILAAILALGAFMRLYRAHDFSGNYWDDPSQPLYDACQITDYRHFFIYAGYQVGEPLFAYAIALVLYLFPSWHGLFVQRLVSALFDITALWVYYLLGKEFGKRRIGLLMASFGAVNRALLMMLLSYMRYMPLPLTLALVLLFSMRLFKKPSLAHFLEWGACIALGYYTYTAFRPMGPYFIAAVLAWILYREKGKAGQAWKWFLGLGLCAYLFFLFLYLHRYILPDQSVWRQGITAIGENSHLAVFICGGLILVFIRNVWMGFRGKSDWSMVYWTLGVLLCVLLVYPIIVNVELLRRLNGMSRLAQGSAQPSIQEILGALAQKFLKTLQFLVYSGGDRSDISLYGDPYFNVSDLVFIVPGVVFALCRPNWPRTFVLLCACVGLIPYILGDAGGNRLIASIPPFLLLGALAFNQLMESSDGALKPRARTAFNSALWILVLSFGGYTAFQKVYNHFFTHMTPLPLLAHMINQDAVKYRVYVASNEGYLPEQVMTEGKNYYHFSIKGNPIDLETGEKIPEVVVLFKTDQFPVPDIVEKMKAQYPRAQWEKSPAFPDHLDSTVFHLRLFIPGDQISKNPSKFIYVRRVPAGHWIRRYYKSDYRLGVGWIYAEDRVTDWNAPLPSEIPLNDIGASTGRLEGLFEVPRDGKYKFAVDVDRPLSLWLGDRLLLRPRPREKKHYEASVRLRAGTCLLSLRVFDPTGRGFPAVKVRYAGEKDWKPLQ